MNAVDIIDYLVSKGMTLTGIGREIGVPHSTVSRWKNGHFNPSRLLHKELVKLKTKHDEQDDRDGA